MTAVDRLNQVVQGVYGGSKSAFASALGWKAGAVYKYLNGEREPGPAFLVRLEDMAGISRRWVESGEGSMFAENEPGRQLSGKHGETKPRNGNPWHIPLIRETVDGMRVESKQVQIPLYLQPAAAGHPVPADEYIEKWLVPEEYVVPNPGTSFAVRATGYSMLYDGIHDGDTLIVDTSVEVATGRVIVAVLNGEVCVKRYERRGKETWLMPANDEFVPVMVKKGMQFKPVGVVIRVIHEL